MQHTDARSWSKEPARYNLVLILESGVSNVSPVMWFAVLQRRIVAQNIKRLKDIGCYRGRRHIMVRTTCCNSNGAARPANLQYTRLGLKFVHIVAVCSSQHSNLIADWLSWQSLQTGSRVLQCVLLSCIVPAGLAHTWSADKDQRTHTQGQAKDCCWQEEVNVVDAAAALIPV